MRRRNLQHPSRQSRLQAEQGGCATWWTQGQETSTTHLFHNWRTLINGIRQTGGAYCFWTPLRLQLQLQLQLQPRPTTSTARQVELCGVAAIKSRLISRPVPVQSAQVQQRQRRLGLLPPSLLPSLGLLRWVSYYTFVAHFNCTFHTC